MRRLISIHAFENINKNLICWCSIGFEYASQPGITEEEKANRLHFAVVGGGPTVGSMLHNVLRSTRHFTEQL